MAPEHSNKKGHNVSGRHKKFSDSLFAWLSCSFEPLNEQLFLANHLESAQSSRVSTGCLQEASTSPGERQAGRHCTSASSALHRHQQHGSIYNPDMYSCSLQWEAGTAGCQPPTTRCLNQLKGWQRAHTHTEMHTCPFPRRVTHNEPSVSKTVCSAKVSVQRAGKCVLTQPLHFLTLPKWAAHCCSGNHSPLCDWFVYRPGQENKATVVFIYMKKRN